MVEKPVEVPQIQFVDEVSCSLFGHRNHHYVMANNGIIPKMEVTSQLSQLLDILGTLIRLFAYLRTLLDKYIAASTFLVLHFLPGVDAP